MPAILIVEDDPLFSSTLADLLEDNRYEVELATRADEAIAKAKKRSFHLVLTDVRIAGPEDGVSALEAIQKIQPNIRSIIMTGYADTEVPLRAARLRADERGCNQQDEQDGEKQSSNHQSLLLKLGTGKDVFGVEAGEHHCS